jgi:hypothetical protein
MSQLIAEADAGDFHLEIRYLDGKWEWKVFYWRTGSQAKGRGESLEDAKSRAEDVAGAKPKLWRPIRSVRGLAEETAS